MKKHVMAITYVPKIDAVKNGQCTQTIRAGDKFSVGDEILLHSWAGRPYHSKWDWRMRVLVTEVYDVLIHESGIHDHKDLFTAWDSGAMDHLAELDHIIPATGVHLYRVLCGCAGTDHVRGDHQIIRWTVMSDE